MNDIHSSRPSYRPGAEEVHEILSLARATLKTIRVTGDMFRNDKSRVFTLHEFHKLESLEFSSSLFPFSVISPSIATDGISQLYPTTIPPSLRRIEYISNVASKSLAAYMFYVFNHFAEQINGTFSSIAHHSNVNEIVMTANSRMYEPITEEDLQRSFNNGDIDVFARIPDVWPWTKVEAAFTLFQTMGISINCQMPTIINATPERKA